MQSVCACRYCPLLTFAAFAINPNGYALRIAGVVDIGQHPALQALILWGNRITSLNFTGAALSRLKVLDLGRSLELNYSIGG